MKFFVPAAKDAAQADYESIRKFNAQQMGASLSPRHIYRVAGVQMENRSRRPSENNSKGFGKW